MFLLYLDDAGSVTSKADKHYVLAGICVFERQVHFLSEALSALAGRLYPPDPDALEFHGSHMLPGKGFWRSIPDSGRRRATLIEALDAPSVLRGHWALFGVVVEKAALAGEDPIEFAFEHIVARFDTFLKREHHQRKNTHRGLIILDKSTRETRLQSLSRDLKKRGHRWGSLANLADVPMFVDSIATRAVQFADLVAYALWRKFEHSDPEFYNRIERFFDREGAVVHGLMHQSLVTDGCDCAWCLMQRRAPR